MPQKLKILFVATEPAPGMVPFAAAVINAFAESGHMVWALTLSSSECSYRAAITEKVSLYDKSFPTSLSGKLKLKFYPRALYEEIVKIATNNGIKNIHLLTGEYGLALHWTQKLNKIYNLVYTVHDLEKHPSTSKTLLKDLKTNLFDSFFHSMTLKNISEVSNLATSSKIQYNNLKKKYPSKKIVYHSFPSLITKEIKSGTKVCPELEGEKDYILFLGTIAYYKGVDILYHAFLNSNLCKQTKMVLAGKGNYFFRTCPKEKNVIRINRYITDDEVANLYKNAKLVVYPYRQATQSGVLSIAHFFQKRVIASDLPYFKDNIGANDVLFQSENTENLTKTLEKEVKRHCNYQDKGTDETDIVNEMLSLYK